MSTVEGKVIAKEVELVRQDTWDEVSYDKQVRLRKDAVKEAAAALRSSKGMFKGRAGNLDDIIALSEYILTGIVPDWEDEGPAPLGKG